MVGIPHLRGFAGYNTEHLTVSLRAGQPSIPPGQIIAIIVAIPTAIAAILAIIAACRCWNRAQDGGDDDDNCDGNGNNHNGQGAGNRLCQLFCCVNVNALGGPGIAAGGGGGCGN